jgi:hypothetical protein
MRFDGKVAVVTGGGSGISSDILPRVVPGQERVGGGVASIGGLPAELVAQPVTDRPPLATDRLRDELGWEAAYGCDASADAFLAWPPISAATACAAASSRSITATRAPASAMSRAVAAPIPDDGAAHRRGRRPGGGDRPGRCGRAGRGGGDRRPRPGLGRDLAVEPHRTSSRASCQARNASAEASHP